MPLDLVALTSVSSTDFDDLDSLPLSYLAVASPSPVVVAQFDEKLLPYINTYSTGNDYQIQKNVDSAGIKQTKTQFCIDCRLLKLMTLTYYLPLIDDILRRLDGSFVISS